MPTRPDRATVVFQAGPGEKVTRDGPVDWLTAEVGFAPVPHVEVGRHVLCVCVWDGRQMHTAPLRGLEAAVLGMALSTLARSVGSLERAAAAEGARLANRGGS